MTEYQVVASPCVGICQLDQNKVCLGCYRSSEEITYWRTYTNEERKIALEKVQERMQAAGL